MVSDLGISEPLPQVFREFVQLTIQIRGLRRVTLWRTGTLYLAWERNNRIFQGRSQEWEKVLDNVRRLVALVLLGHEAFKHCQWGQLCGP
ncbi:hypothetical protein Scep_028413 [Stephania cephalantha]|uniref:Uncharacterized protein n=1 Tax=Stephania cephalantha TaxID=152367 RepID=A0AAP0E9X0_9MAGN